MESIVQGNNQFDGIEPRWRWIYCPESASSVLIILCLTACAKDLKSLFEADRQTKATETYDNIALQGALEKILGWHQTNETGHERSLNPGLSRAAVNEQFARTACLPTQEMIQLWSWHNGTGATSIPLIWYHAFLSLENPRMNGRGC